MLEQTKGAPENPLTPDCAPPPAKPAAPRKHSWKFKLSAVLIALFAIHLLLEIVLRVAGFVYYHDRISAADEKFQYPPNARVILCVGDSCTAGVGASNWTRDQGNLKTNPHWPQSASYPSQLQRLLDRRAPGQNWHVAKHGYPGANTSQMAKRLESFIRLNRPEVLILLIGNNDVWNLNETRAQMFVGVMNPRAILLRAAMALDSLRVVRFYKWTYHYLGEDSRRKEFNAMKGVNPNQRHFRNGMKIFGSLDTVEELYRYNYKEMCDTAERMGVQQVIFLDYHKIARNGETGRIEPALESLGIEAVELSPEFDKIGEAGVNLISRDGWHANDLGYAIFARMVFNELVGRGIVQAEPLPEIQPDNLHPILASNTL